MPFQEFDFEFIINPTWLNSGPDHLSRIENGEEPINIDDSLPDAQLFVITMFHDHYRDNIQIFSTRHAPAKFTTTQKK